MRTKKLYLVVVMLAASLVLSLVSMIITNRNLAHLQDTVESQNTYVKFQDRMSMDWDEDEYLLWIAQEKGGSVEDRAYTILVTLNRVVELGYPISTMVELELGTKFPENFIVDYQSMEALHMITHERFDNSEGSLRYRN